mgnify:CR=1 FL=1
MGGHAEHAPTASFLGLGVRSSFLGRADRGGRETAALLLVSRPPVRLANIYLSPLHARGTLWWSWKRQRTRLSPACRSLIMLPQWRRTYVHEAVWVSLAQKLVLAQTREDVSYLSALTFWSFLKEALERRRVRNEAARADS